jgi:hypothetical protein
LRNMSDIGIQTESGCCVYTKQTDLA